MQIKQRMKNIEVPKSKLKHFSITTILLGFLMFTGCQTHEYTSEFHGIEGTWQTTYYKKWIQSDDHGHSDSTEAYYFPVEGILEENLDEELTAEVSTIEGKINKYLRIEKNILETISIFTADSSEVDQTCMSISSPTLFIVKNNEIIPLENTTDLMEEVYYSLDNDTLTIIKLFSKNGYISQTELIKFRKTENLDINEIALKSEEFFPVESLTKKRDTSHIRKRVNVTAI